MDCFPQVSPDSQVAEIYSHDVTLLKGLTLQPSVGPAPFSASALRGAFGQNCVSGGTQGGEQAR